MSFVFAFVCLNLFLHAYIYIYTSIYTSIYIHLYLSIYLHTGEELFIDYGSEWEFKWDQYMQQVQQQIQQQPSPLQAREEESIFYTNLRSPPHERITVKPFRHPIEAPKGLFPKQWLHMNIPHVWTTAYDDDDYDVDGSNGIDGVDEL